MSRSLLATSVALTCSIGMMAGGGWVTFVNDTAVRLPTGPGGNDPLLSTADTQEKDYAWADVDKDGDIDLVVVRKEPFTSTGRRENVLFMNEGTAEGHATDGVFINRTSQFIPDFLDKTNDRDVVIADVDGDGWLDIVTSTTLSGLNALKSFGHPRIYINLGEDLNGDWLGYVYDDVDRVPTMATEPRFCGVAAGDVDGDGDVDLVFADYDQGPYSRPIDLNNRLWINDGTGYFTDESTLRMTSNMRNSSFGTSVVIADMNGDGKLDIINNSGLALRRTGISYNGVPEGMYDIFGIPYEEQGYFVTAGDLNNDGMLDLVIPDDGIDAYLLGTGNGAGGIANFTQHDFQNSNGFGGNAVIADLDNDGFNDVLIADVDVDIVGCDRFLHIYENLGNTPNVTMTEDTSVVPSAFRQGVHDIAVFDINGDCLLDLVIGRCSGTEVWINTTPGLPVCAPCPWDLNGDGTVGITDFLDVLGAWGSDPGGPPDFDGDGTVGINDFLALLANWGACS